MDCNVIMQYIVEQSWEVLTGDTVSITQNWNSASQIKPKGKYCTFFSFLADIPMVVVNSHNGNFITVCDHHLADAEWKYLYEKKTCSSSHSTLNIK